MLGTIPEFTDNVTPHKATVLLVDDHPLVREWLGNLINQQLDLQVCGEAGNSEQAIQLIEAFKPDIVVVDISLDGSSGLDLIKTIKIAHPNIAVIVLSMHDESLYAERALLAGAKGYIMKSEVTKKVLQGIRCVLGCKPYFSNEITMMMVEKYGEKRHRTKGAQIESLSVRELEVFHLLGRGYNTRKIADEMHVSFKTVQSFCARIKEKLSLNNATELLREAIRWYEANKTSN